MQCPHDNRSSSPPEGLTGSSFETIRKMIYDYCGIYFEDNKRYLLESRVHQRMQVIKTRSYDDYVATLRREGVTGELGILVEAVTINETYFFRHPAQIELLEQHLLPELILRKQASSLPRIRIWSAACSSGDEIFSVAMMIRERLQPQFPRTTFELIGTDIDAKILTAAQRGSYAAYAVRNVPESLLKKYFTSHGDRWLLDRSIRDMVRFRKLNLSDRLAMRSMQAFDVILCANVLIYFDADAKRRVLDALHDSLSPEGYLFIGFSETLYGVTPRFIPVKYDRSLVYRRADAIANGHPVHPVLQTLNPILNQAS
ncbi:MAG: CheR family methyltransferase [Bacteroidota bacterium]